MKYIVLLCVFIAVVLASVSDEIAMKKFIAFQHKYNKIYKSDEELLHRFAIFKENLVKAEQYQKREKGSATYGVTKFSDLCESEFRSTYLLPHMNISNIQKAPVANVKSLPKVLKSSTNFDWRSKGVITPVYNQEQCGSCWAFSATETIESYWALAGNSLVELSVQQIVDCDTAGEDEGCDGGWPYGAYEYIIGANGQELLADYQYTGEDGTCQFNSADIGATISSWQYVAEGGNESPMMPWVTSKGPLSICVDASSWSYYTGGVISTCTQNLDHCVQLTGYSPEDGYSVWNVRNSWGSDWGVDGYIYLERNQNMCGCAEVVTVPIV